jgi:hypothetical protein
MAEYNAAKWSFWLDERQKRDIGLRLSVAL